MAKKKAKKKDQEKPRRAISLGDTALTVASSVEEVPLVDGFSVTVNGLVVHGTPQIENWTLLGNTLRVAERSIQFAIGDYINQAEATFGEEASQLIDYSDGWSEKTCAVYAWMARRIAPSDRRMDRLTIKHHLMVASLSPAQQRKWLAKAANDHEEKPWTTSRLAQEMRGDPSVAHVFWVVVGATSEADQAQLMEQLEAQGRSVKARTDKIKLPGGAQVPDAESASEEDA